MFELLMLKTFYKKLIIEEKFLIMEIQNIRIVYIRIMHVYYDIKLTENSVVFCILFSRRLSFWNLHQMSWLNNYVLEDACRSR